MKERLIQIPGPLRKQLLLRLGGCVFSIAMLVIVLLSAVEATLLLPCFLLVVICLGSGWLLWERCVQKRYVVIEGTCTDIERSSLHKRIKAIYIRQGEKTVKIAGMGAIKNLCVGDTVTVYVADTTDVYEVDGYLVVCSYLAIVRGGTGDESRRDICQA